jgi:hypothetical protein
VVPARYATGDLEAGSHDNLGGVGNRSRPPPSPRLRCVDERLLTARCRGIGPPVRDPEPRARGRSASETTAKAVAVVNRSAHRSHRLASLPRTDLSPCGAASTRSSDWPSSSPYGSVPAPVPVPEELAATRIRVLRMRSRHVGEWHPSPCGRAVNVRAPPVEVMVEREKRARRPAPFGVPSEATRVGD